MDFTGERYIPGVGGSIALEHEHRYRFCLDIIEGCNVLDLACGEGFGSAMLANRAAKVWGVDIDHAAVTYASQRYIQNNLEYRLGSCANIPLPDGSVDAAVSFETIEHHDEHEKMMLEIRRVLRPGGVLIISSPDRKIYSDERRFKNEFHVKELYSEELIALLNGHFKHVEMSGQRIVYGSLIVPVAGEHEAESYGINATEPSKGLHAPLYQLAIASDNPGWAKHSRSSLLEETVYRSEAIIERGHLAAKEKAALQAHIRKFEKDKTELKVKIRALEKEKAKQSKVIFYSTGLRRFYFHGSGRPRGWLRALLLSNKKQGTPRELMRRILFKKSGKVRPVFADWYSQFEGEPVNMKRLEYGEFLRQQLADGLLQMAETLHVVTTQHTEVIGEAIEVALAGTRLKITRGTKVPKIFDHDLYIVVAPQMFKTLPPMEKTIIFQVEQVRASKWVDSPYLEQLHACLAVLDYSRDNIAALIERDLSFKQIYHVPVLPFPRAQAESRNRDIDVLFYGSTASDRRHKYLDALSKRVKVHIVKDKFGSELRDMLDRAKIVVNIHFYNDALLETTRLSEALSHGAYVVSECAVDQNEHTHFGKAVSFVPRDNVDAFVQSVEAALAAWAGPSEIVSDNWLVGMRYHLLRALHGVGVLSFEDVLAACDDVDLPSNRLVLALPEHTARYDFALENLITGAVIFPGLRNIDGWKGCANSYKLMASLARRQGLKALTIYEEDAAFDFGTVARIEKIESYLSQTQDWDVFSGLLSDLHPNARVTGIEHVGNEEYIHLDSVIGMVFGIYNHTAIALISDFEFEGDDTAKHTIDRYLETQQLRCITVIPPIARHDEVLVSSLWATDKSIVSDTIYKSIARLKSKKDEYKAKISDRSVGL